MLITTSLFYVKYQQNDNQCLEPHNGNYRIIFSVPIEFLLHWLTQNIHALGRNNSECILNHPWCLNNIQRSIPMYNLTTDFHRVDNIWAQLVFLLFQKIHIFEQDVAFVHKIWASVSVFNRDYNLYTSIIHFNFKHELVLLQYMLTCFLCFVFHFTFYIFFSSS